MWISIYEQVGIHLSQKFWFNFNFAKNIWYDAIQIGNKSSSVLYDRTEFCHQFFCGLEFQNMWNLNAYKWAKNGFGTISLSQKC